MPSVYQLRSEWRGERRGEPRASAVSSSLLDKRTLTGESGKKAGFSTVICVTNLEKVGVLDIGFSSGGGNRGVKGKSRSPEINQERALRRARRRVRLACLNIQARYILTLTYHDNMQDRERAMMHRQEFDRRMRKHYPLWQYIGVLEAQKRGALHWHLAIPKPVDVGIALEEWRIVTGDPTITEVHMGFRPDGNGNAYVKCAHYVSKYIGKAMNQRHTEQHRYHVPRGITPTVERYHLPAGSPRETIRRCLAIAIEILGDNVDLWTAPTPEGAVYGFLRAQRAQLQGASDGEG